MTVLRGLFENVRWLPNANVCVKVSDYEGSDIVEFKGNSQTLIVLPILDSVVKPLSMTLDSFLSQVVKV